MTTQLSELFQNASIQSIVPENIFIATKIMCLGQLAGIFNIWEETSNLATLLRKYGNPVSLIRFKMPLCNPSRHKMLVSPIKSGFYVNYIWNYTQNA